MNYLLYQAYGNKDIINEAIYSLFSYYYIVKDELSGEVKVVVYTDDIPAFEHFFSGKDFIYRPLTKELIKEWKGSIDFVHRVKIKILQDFFSDHPDANVLYVDSDTVFKTNPAVLYKSIADNRFVMHTMEGVIKDKTNPIFNKLYKYLVYNDIIVPGSVNIRVSIDTQMWNAGVIGINDKQKNILEKVLDFTDSLYPHFPKHIVEQFAFSYYFQNNAEIIPAEPYIFHYWNFKEFRTVLTGFFERYKDDDLQSVLNKIHDIDPQKLIISKLEYESQSGPVKFIRKILGKKWKMNLTQFPGYLISHKTNKRK